MMQTLRQLRAFVLREQFILCSIVALDGSFILAALPPAVWRRPVAGCVVCAVVATAVIVSLANLITFLMGWTLWPQN